MSEGDRDGDGDGDGESEDKSWITRLGSTYLRFALRTTGLFGAWARLNGPNTLIAILLGFYFLGSGVTAISLLVLRHLLLLFEFSAGLEGRLLGLVLLYGLLRPAMQRVFKFWSLSDRPSRGGHVCEMLLFESLSG